MRVLISAYACEPGAGSEPGAGWAWSRAAALDHDVWVLTRANNAGPIEAALAAEPSLRYTPVYLDLPPWARFWKKWPMGVQVYYLLWQVLAWHAARRLHREIGFDVAHHLTFAVDWMPAGVGFVKGPRFVWGPVGGATGVPWQLWRWLGWRGVTAELTRECVTRVLRLLFGRASARRASLVVAQNDDAARLLPRTVEVAIEPNVAVAIPVGVGSSPRCCGESGMRDALFVGRAVPLKGLRLAVAALACEPARHWTLSVFGEGRELKSAARLARRLGVSSRVIFCGTRHRSEVLSALSTADALLLPSMHDAAGWAVAEAVSAGCPTVCLDRGGPPLLIGSVPGAGVAVDGTSNIPERLAEALASVNRTRPSARWSDARLRDVVAGILAGVHAGAA